MASAPFPGRRRLNVGDHVVAATPTSFHQGKHGSVVEVLEPLGDLVYHYRVRFEDGSSATFFGFELELSDHDPEDSGSDHEPSTALLAVPLLERGKAELRLHQIGRHSIVITEIWIWPEGKASLGGRSVGVLDGDLMQLEPHTKKRVDVTEAILKAVNRTNAVGAGLWIAFDIQPTPTAYYPGLGLHGVDIQNGCVIRFESRPRNRKPRI